MSSLGMKIGIEAHTIEKIEKLGAGGNYLANLLKEWSKLNPDKYQFVLYFKDKIPSDDFLKSPVFYKKIIKNPFNIKSTALFYNLSMPIAAKKDKVDILFLPFYMRPFFCYVPTITTVHDISYKAHPEWFSWNYKLPFSILGGLAVKTSILLLVPSKYSKKEIIKYYKILADRIYVIHLAADKGFNNKKNEEKIKKVKQKYGLSKKYLFYIGTIFNRRHLIESIKAFEKLLKDGNNDYQFLISGRDFTKPVQNINKQIKKTNDEFPNAIKKVNYVRDNDLLYLYQGAEFFVWLSEYEGFGLPILEAMACGTPILTTKMTSLGEVIGDYPMSVDNPSDISEIKEKMEKLLTNKELRKNLIKRGLERAQKFSWQKCAKETLEILCSKSRHLK